MIRALVALALLLVSAFAAYGLFATREPSADAGTWRWVYSALLAASLFGAARVLAAQRGSSR